MRDLQVGGLVVRQARKADLPAYVAIQKVGWGESAVARKQAESRFSHNLEGILVAENDGKVLGSVTTIRIDEYDHSQPKSWYAVTANGYCTSHKPKGKICFGVDLSVDPTSAPKGTVDALFVGSLAMVISMGVKYLILGGRMPNYRLYADKLSPNEYLYKKKQNGHYLDPQVDMYKRVPFMKIMGLAPNYFKDPPSKNYGVILRCRNPFYKLPFKSFWAAATRRIFEVYLTRQRLAYEKKVEKKPA